ncbi:MAG: GIY-YIG nuclease family protein [Gammaproteobacteria bacterium]|nr:GIY-YIG nuclease family protein [Gammaproteobacteria bacterium]NNF67522.1 GIY-YIG nuclease family protein [Gammaproteobacteria bacterium]
MEQDWKVYIVRCADQSLYTGITNNLQHRIDTHNLGRGARYTRCRLPVTLVYSEQAADRSSALQREYQIKSLSLPAKRKLIET